MQNTAGPFASTGGSMQLPQARMSTPKMRRRNFRELTSEDESPPLRKELELLEQLEGTPDEEKSRVVLFAEGLLNQRITVENRRRARKRAQEIAAAEARQAQEWPHQLAPQQLFHSNH